MKNSRERSGPDRVFLYCNKFLKRKASGSAPVAHSFDTHSYPVHGGHIESSNRVRRAAHRGGVHDPICGAPFSPPWMVILLGRCLDHVITSTVGAKDCMRTTSVWALLSTKHGPARHGGEERRAEGGRDHEKASEKEQGEVQTTSETETRV